MKHLRHYFTRWGAPEQLATEDETYRENEKIAAFLNKSWSAATRLFSAQYPDSNGLAKAAVNCEGQEETMGQHGIGRQLVQQDINALLQ